MTMTDPLADMFTRVRNAAMARHETVRIPNSKVKHAVAQVLRDEGFIKKMAEIDEGSRKYLELEITYGNDRQAVLSGIRRVSRPGLRVYVNKQEICLLYTSDAADE